MEWINISQVLAEITDDEHAGKTFVIRFVRSVGKKKGSIKTVAKAVYGAAKRKAQSSAPADNTNKPRKHVDAGTIPMTDTETGKYFTPLISHIIEYNNFKVRH
jgi:hypothetical protein